MYIIYITYRRLKMKCILSPVVVVIVIPAYLPSLSRRWCPLLSSRLGEEKNTEVESRDVSSRAPSLVVVVVVAAWCYDGDGSGCEGGGGCLWPL
jgi:hypothetical protein